jgi:histidine ammonia-lyase
MSDRPATQTSTAVALGDHVLTRQDVVWVARQDAVVSLTDSARRRLEESHARVERLAASGEPVYGVSTGFGALSTTRIPPERWSELQESLVLSHAAGMGAPVEREVVRAMMLLRARTLALGYSGVRPEVVETLVAVLNTGLTPIVPEYGSLGASGDLAPLAHASLVLLGRGEVTDREGNRHPGSAALEAAGVQPLSLAPQGGVVADQRHGRHAGHAVAVLRGLRAALPHGRCGRRHERRGAAGYRFGL